MIQSCIDLGVANVYGIYGHLGGGKTLTAVEIMKDIFLRRGWPVASNIALKNIPDLSNFTYIDDFTQVDWWSLPCGAPRGSLDPTKSAIVIDECAEFFDQYSSTSPLVKNFLSWLRHSSKRGQFVFLIIQRPEFLAKSARQLVHKWIICDDLYQVRLPVLKIRLPFCSDLVSRRTFDKLGNRISSGLNLVNKSYIGNFYDTSQSIAVAGRSNNYVNNTNIDAMYQHLLIINFFLLLLILFYIYY